jgi:non-ribosomal peptide synthetase component F
MTLSHEFWYSQLQGCNLQHPLSLPTDRQRASTDQRSGLASTSEIIFDNEISLLFLNYASLHNLTPFQLGLAIFYTFLFKLTHGETDLCISSINANRYRNELENMIGMFVSTLPYRLQFDSRWSFDELVKHVRKKCLSILEHSHYPLQHILSDFQLNQSNVSFLETVFDFISVSADINHFSFNDACLEQVSIEQSYEVAKFDFSMTFIYNPTSNIDKLSCCFVCSRDLFEETTVAHIARRFQHLFEQLFRTKSCNSLADKSVSAINEMSLILPEESEEIQSVVFHRVEDIVNEGM